MTNIYDSTNISSQEAARHLPAAAVNSASAVSWGAIFAGAAAAASLALMLLMLGAGLGLTSISPWENQGLAAGTVGIAAIAWLTFTQIVASGMGDIWPDGFGRNGLIRIPMKSISAIRRMAF